MRPHGPHPDRQDGLADNVRGALLSIAAEIGVVVVGLGISFLIAVAVFALL